VEAIYVASISATLRKINHYWKTGKVAPEFLKAIVRSEFGEIQSSLRRERILAIIGPRRVGKSTLLFQTIEHLLKIGVNPKNILFFSGDEPALFSGGKVSIGALVESYELDVLGKRLEDAEDTIYILIDEIHAIPDWQLWLKSYFDRKYKIKFIVSGSSSTHLFRGSRESLMGRIENVYVLPLGFREFARFCAQYGAPGLGAPPFGAPPFGAPAFGQIPAPAWEPELGLRLFELLPDFSVFDKPVKYAEDVSALISELEGEKAAVRRLLYEYLLVGGYPEYFAARSLLHWQRQLAEDIVSRGLFRDVVSIYSIKNPEILERLLYFVAANNGQPHAFSTLASTMGVDFATISNYLHYLSSAFMITVLENYSPNAGKIIRKNKKLYVSDSGLSNALLRVDELTDELAGHLAEQCCVKQARAYAEANLCDVRYYREGNVEIDIVLDKKSDLLPIEVKFRGRAGAADAKPARDFMGAFGSRNGLVITKDRLDVQGNIAFVPFWLLN
jgi:predicted AAA+ superfamily ATPase